MSPSSSVRIMFPEAVSKEFPPEYPVMTGMPFDRREILKSTPSGETAENENLYVPG